jgi:hypothetical protein
MSWRPARLLALMGALASGAAALPAAAESVPVRVGRDACEKVVAHVPDADVAYRPGVDVNGRPVAPADLPGGNSVEAPDGFVITLQLDLRRSGFHVPRPRGLDPEVQLGLITVQGNRVYYNGQPLDDPNQQQLAAACREFLKRQH